MFEILYSYKDNKRNRMSSFFDMSLLVIAKNYGDKRPRVLKVLIPSYIFRLLDRYC